MATHLTGIQHAHMNAGPALYTTRVDGHLGATALCAFPALIAQEQLAQTVLTGFLDRAALYGVLAKMEMLGLDLVEVHQVKPAAPTPEHGDTQP